MTTEARPYVSQVRREGMAAGRTEGVASAVLLVLEARGVDITDDARDRILACHTMSTLNTWAKRAATIKTVDELFA